jgi:two-component system, chemotaxis family, protein-glutamate methylesterase/glutaminase
MANKVRIMIVDDTITYRQILSNVVSILANTELVGTASSGKTAVMKFKSLKPHLVFLDVMMPEMDGIETLKALKKINPNVQVVMVSGFDMANAKATLESLENGALDFVAKPTAQNIQDGVNQLQNALEPLVEIVLNKVFPKSNIEDPVPIEKPVNPLVKRASRKEIGSLDYILIGISTGGPNALQKLFESINISLNCPILIVQHMPPMFTKSLAERLNQISVMNIVEASDQETPQNGHVYIAPGGKHMVIRKNSKNVHEIRIIDSPPVNHCKPSVDILFRSVAGLRSAKHVSIVMTGMGKDGTDGLRSLKRKGTYCLIQDEKSSVVWGMPGSVYGESMADEVLPLDKIGKRIVELTNQI